MDSVRVIGCSTDDSVEPTATLMTRSCLKTRRMRTAMMTAMKTTTPTLAQARGANLRSPRRSRKVCLFFISLLTQAPAHFPSKRPSSDSSDEDYATKSHKKKFFERSGGNSRGTSTPDTAFDSDGASWRRGAARKVVTYNEASVDYGLDSEGDDDVMYYQQEARVGESMERSHLSPQTTETPTRLILSSPIAETRSMRRTKRTSRRPTS